VLNTYYKADNRISNPVLSTAKFTAGRDEVYPIPQHEIDVEQGKLVQNPNY
jgi:starch-binding outer membrane protein, SusD/RagB family